MTPILLGRTEKDTSKKDWGLRGFQLKKIKNKGGREIDAV